MELEEEKRPQKWVLSLKLGLLIVFTLVFFRVCNQTADGLGSYFLPTVVSLAVIFWAVLWNRKVPAALSWIFCALVPAAHFLLMESIQQHTRDIVQKMLYLNFAFFYLAFFVLFFLFRGHSEIAVLIGTVLTWLCTTANAVCWQFRSLPILPWDLRSAGVALSVVDNYHYEYTPKFWFVQLMFVLIAVLGFRLRVRQWMPKPFHFSFAGVLTVLLAGLLLYFQTDTMFKKFGGYPYLFTPTVYYERNGTAVSFLSTLRYLNVDKPDGYDRDAIQARAAEYPADAIGNADELPNIIVIMNEAFSDLRPLGEFETNIPVTPFIDSMEENTVKGNLYVSVKGGNTANTEYEFLTGDSMAFLPAGSIPYQQYVKADIPSFVTHLESLGYESAAIHPYYANGWFRDTVYPHLGFDSATFLEDLRPFYTSQVIRNYYSDKTLFDRVFRMIDDPDDDTPRFVFAVTMQNHGSYDEEFPNFRPDIEVVGLEGYKRISAYLSLIRKTDDAFASLIEKVDQSDKKTVVLMFGDHQPNDSVISSLNTLNGVPNTTANLDGENRYITPFILYANYDIAESTVDRISVNYLSSLLCEVCGIPRSGYQKYLAALYEDFPVITARTVVSAENGSLSEEEIHALLTEKDSPLCVYQSFAYSHVFDEENRLAAFFD